MEAEDFRKKEDCHMFQQQNDHPSGYIVERITDRWTDHIEFSGLLFLEPVSACTVWPVRIERMDVTQICMQQPSVNACTCNADLRLVLCCCLLDSRGRRFQRNGYIELDAHFLKQRRSVCDRKGQNIRVAVRILQAQIMNGVARCDDAISVSLEIELEFVCSCQGMICSDLNMGMNRNTKHCMYPQPIGCKRM